MGHGQRVTALPCLSVQAVADGRTVFEASVDVVPRNLVGCSQKNGASAKGTQRMLERGSYQTA